MPAVDAVRADSVSVNLGGRTILRRVTLTIARNESTAIIGESGCGKTVLLKVMVGLIRPSHGTIVVDGCNVAAASDGELRAVRRRMGFLFQGAALFDSLSVGDNIAYPLRSAGGKTDAQIAAVIRNRLEEVGLGPDAMGKLPAELSGGMRKRVGLARALALDPDLMMYDEPTTGLDPVTTEKINDLIVQTRMRRPLTSIVVTHEMKTVRRCADRVIMLQPAAKLADSESQVIYDGPTAGLFESPDPRIRAFVG